MAIPNTTPTPNELYNGEMKKMSDTELRVVLVVTRATLGWELNEETGMRKQEDWISHRQLMKQTGKSSRSISRAIDTCIKKGWIEIRDSEGNLLNTKNKRVGKKMFFRLGRIFLDRISTPDKSKEVEFQPLTKVKRLAQTPDKSKIDKSKAYKRNTITKYNTPLYSPLNKYPSLKNIEPEDLQEIAQKYHVPLGFVQICLERMTNWLEAKGKKYKNYKRGLMNWVLSEAQSKMENKKGGFVDAEL